MDIMIDLETLSVEPNAVVLSIGTCEFDINGNIGAQNHMILVPTIDEQVALGRHIGGDTVAWWMRQGAMAKLLFSQQLGGISYSSVSGALDDLDASFAKLRGRHPSGMPGVWGNGAGFDNVILETLYRQFDRRPPWHFGNNRCFRTLRALAPHIPYDREGVEHNALDDAISQAKHAQKVFRWLSQR